jgi:hypothetical protein
VSVVDDPWPPEPLFIVAASAGQYRWLSQAYASAIASGALQVIQAGAIAATAAEQPLFFEHPGSDEAHPQMFLTGDRNVTNGQAANSRFVDLTTNRPVGWTHELHKVQGNIGLADGSVQQFSTARLQEALAATGDSTNRLAMPY